jgi:hypothetical protein
MLIPKLRSLTDSILRTYQAKAGLGWASCPESTRQVNPDWFLKLGLYKSIREINAASFPASHHSEDKEDSDRRPRYNWSEGIKYSFL